MKVRPQFEQFKPLVIVHIGNSSLYTRLNVQHEWIQVCTTATRTWKRPCQKRSVIRWWSELVAFSHDRKRLAIEFVHIMVSELDQRDQPERSDSLTGRNPMFVFEDNGTAYRKLGQSVEN